MSEPWPPPASIIVCERTGHWAAALRRQLGDLNVELHETRSVVECLERLTQQPTSVALIEIYPPWTERVVSLLETSSQRFPSAQLCLAIPENQRAVIPWLRQLGAAEVVFATRQLDRVMRVIRRQAALYPGLELTVLERHLRKIAP